MKRLRPLLLLICLSPLLWGGPAEDLVVAEQNLRISEETLSQIEADLEALQKTAGSDPSLVAEYEAYAERSRSIVAANRTKVEALRKLAPPPPAAPEAVPEFQIAKPEPTWDKNADEDPIAALDRQLNQSVAEFDKRLLREMEEIAQDRNAGASGVGAAGGPSAGGGSGASGSGGEGPNGEQAGGGEGAGGEGAGGQGEMAGGGAGGQAGGPPPGGGEAGGQKPGGGPEGGNPGQGGDVAGLPQGTPGGNPGSPVGQGGGIGKPTTPPPAGGPRGNPATDDIVAKQIREAAENEKDPVLKEKLWKEYEAYKRGR